MQTTTAAPTPGPHNLICDECGAALDLETKSAYKDLYGPYNFNSSRLEQKLRDAIEQDLYDAGPHNLTYAALAMWLGYEPEALALAVQHRLAEEEAQS